MAVCMDKDQISRLIAAKSDRVSFSSCNGKSEVWPRFSKVIVDGVFRSYVMCTDCRAILKWKAKDGTSGLKAHTLSCKAGKPACSRKLGDCVGVTALVREKRISTADRNGVTEAAVRFCARDIRVSV